MTKEVLNENTKYVDPLSEAGFRQIFGQKESEALLLAMLNEMMEYGRRIESIELLELLTKEDVKQEDDAILDFRCRLTNGKWLIVGLALCGPGEFEKRTIFYHCNTVVKTEEGKERERMQISSSMRSHFSSDDDENWIRFRELCKPYNFQSVYFLNFTTDTLRGNFEHRECYMDMETKKPVDFLPVFKYYQFPLFNKQAEDCQTLLDKLMYVFKNMTTLERMPESFTEDVFPLLDRLATRVNS